jgi:uncharacterized membrane protein
MKATQAKYVTATTDQLLAGKQFNRGVRGLMLAYEALSALRLASFFFMV